MNWNFFALANQKVPIPSISIIKYYFKPNQSKPNPTCMWKDCGPIDLKKSHQSFTAVQIQFFVIWVPGCFLSSWPCSFIRNHCMVPRFRFLFCTPMCCAYIFWRIGTFYCRNGEWLTQYIPDTLTNMSSDLKDIVKQVWDGDSTTALTCLPKI